MFIGLCILLTLTFGIALFVQWREDNARKDMKRDLRREFYDKVDKK